VTKLSGLYIDGKFEPPTPSPSSDPEVRAMKELFSNRPLKFNLPFLDDICLQAGKEIFSIIFHNVQSLNAHYEDIIWDKSYRSAIFFVLLRYGLCLIIVLI